MGERAACCVLLVTVMVMMMMLAGVRAMDEEMAELAKMVRESCAGETGVDLALVEAVNAGADLTPEPKLKCYIKCTMETAGMMSEGEVDVDMILSLMCEDMKAKSEATLRACGTQRGTDDCDTAFLTQQCWQQKNKPIYMLI